LSQSWYYVIPKSDAESALTVIREGVRNDLVITDYQIPGLGGSAFMITITGLVPSMPVIVLTTHSNVVIYVKSMRLGVFEYITKPIITNELQRIVKAA
jgi:two-component system, NtrC family, response regulator HydG